MQDFLTSSFLLTSKDRFYTRAQIGQLMCQMGDALNGVELPQPALLKPLELWTGKQVFTMLVRPSSRARCCSLVAAAFWTSGGLPILDVSKARRASRTD